MAFGAYGTDLASLPSPAAQSFLSWPAYATNFRIAQALSLEPLFTAYISNAIGTEAGNATEDDPISIANQSTMDYIIGILAGFAIPYELKFRRGETYPFSVSIDCSSVPGGYRITDWGDPNETSMPILSAWSQTGYAATDNAWTLDSGNRYYKTVNPTREIGWIREVNDKFNPYTYVKNTTRCADVPHSWYQAATSANFTANAGTNVCTSAGHGLSDGTIVRLSHSVPGTPDLPAGLAVEQEYYIISSTTDTFKLSLTAGGSEIDITDAGTGTHTWNKASTLYINCGGDNPNDLDLEVVPTRCGLIDGVAFTGAPGTGNTSFYAENIVTDGFGATPYVYGTNATYGWQMGATNYNIHALVNCEAYYTGRHIFGMTANNGVWVTKNCKGGYGTNDCTDWVTFGGTGSPEGYHINPVIAYGKAPSEAYADNSVSAGPIVSQGDVSTESTHYCHTGGGGALVALLFFWGASFEDNRSTHSRATYAMPIITGADIVGTAATLSTLRMFVNWNPYNGLVTRGSHTVTADATADTFTKTAHGFSNGDMVQFTTTGTMPGSVTQGQHYAVINKTANDFQIVTITRNMDSVDTSTDTITRSNHGLSNAQRVMFVGSGIPGGLDNTTLYYVVGATTNTFQVSLTNGGAAVDITTEGYGRRRFVGGTIVNISSAGTGVHTAKVFDIENSRFFTPSFTSPAFCYINCLRSGKLFTSATSSNEATFINNLLESINSDVGTCSVMNPGGHEYYCHTISRPTGSFNIYHSQASTSTTNFNSIVDNQGTSALQQIAGDLNSYTVTADNTTNIFTRSSHGLSVNQVIRFFTTGTLPTNITANTDYYVISDSFTTGQFKVSLTQGGLEVDFTTDGTGTLTFIRPSPLTQSRGIGYFDTYGSVDNQLLNDDYKVNTTTPTTLGAPVGPSSAFYHTGYPTPNSIDIEYDFYGRSRNLAAPNIGPIEGAGIGTGSLLTSGVG